jgi:ABC-type multidrug transport system ATPase subunit
VVTPIVAEGVRRTFAGVSVLAGVDLVVEGGESVALLGANGAGKTTLLRVLATLLRPSAGRLVLFGEDAKLRPATALGRIGYVGHESACYVDLTAEENLAFYADLYRVPDPARRVAELVEWTGLGSAARRPVRTFSRGMAQRLALARALVHRPELLLLDEPFSGLDPRATAELEALLTTLRQSGHAVVFSTHDVPRAAALATRVVMLHRGRIEWSDAGGDAAAGVAIASRFEALVTTIRGV